MNFHHTKLGVYKTTDAKLCHQCIFFYVISRVTYYGTLLVSDSPWQCGMITLLNTHFCVKKVPVLGCGNPVAT